MRSLGPVGYVLVGASVLLAQTASPPVSTVSIQVAREQLRQLQGEIAAALKSLPPLPPKDQYESTAEYGRRNQAWFELRDQRLGPILLAEEKLKSQLYLDASEKPEFVSYDADAELLAANISGGACYFRIPKETAKSMHDSWSKVAVAENLETIAVPSAGSNRVRNQAPTSPPALALVFGSSSYTGFSKGTTVPMLLWKVEPELSEEARKRRASAWEVVLAALIKGGKVEGIRIVKGAGLGLDEKAIEAVRRWKFSVASENCVPVAKELMITVRFRTL